MSSTCPFCSYTVTPARAPTGALVCPLCRNTGKTDRPDAEAFRRALHTFERRVVEHLRRTQDALEGNLPATATGVDDETGERLAALETDLEALRAAHQSTATATGIRLAEVAAHANVDDLVTAVNGLRDDVRALHDEYARARVPELRQRVRVLGERVNALEASRRGGADRRAAERSEWERPEPWTMEEADEPPVWATERDTEQEQTAEPEPRGQSETPLVVADYHDPTAKAEPRRRDESDYSGVPPVMDEGARLREVKARNGPDYSGVPPVMDEGARLREVMARDVVRMPVDADQADEPRAPAGDATLAGIDAALHDIDERLRSLRRP